MMKKRLVWIQEGKSTRIGFEKTMARLERTRFHIQQLDEKKKAERLEQFTFLEGLLLKVNPEDLPIEKQP